MNSTEVAEDLAAVLKALQWHVAPIRKTDERPYMDALAATKRLIADVEARDDA